MSLTLAACGPGSDDGSEQHGDAARLERLDGVRAASVETVEVYADQSVDVPVVDMEPEATEEQVVEVVRAVADLDLPKGDVSFYDGAVYLGAGSTEWAEPDRPPASGLWFVTDAMDQLEPQVAWLMRARRLVDEGANEGRVDEVDGAPNAATVGDAASPYRIRVDSASLVEVSRIADDVAEDPLLSAPAGVRVEARADGYTVGSLSTYGSLGTSEAALWAALAGTDRTENGTSIDALDVDLSPAGVSARTRFILPGDPPAREVTTDAYGADLWPTLEAQLDLFRTFPHGSTLSAETAPVEGDDYDDATFLDVEAPESFEPDRLGRTWNTEAADYLGSGD